MRHPSPVHRRLVIAAVLGIAVVAALIVFLRFRALSAHPERLIGPQLAMALGREVTVGRAHAGLNGRIVLEDVRIADGRTLKQGTLLIVPRLEVQVDLLGAAFRGVPLLSAIQWVRLERPHLWLVRTRSGVWNVASLAGAAAGGKGPPIHAQVTLSKAVVDVFDFRAHVIHLPARNRLIDVSGTVSALPSGAFGFTVDGKGTGGRLGPVRLDGTYALDKFLAQVRVRAQDASLPYWSDYLANIHWASVTDGRADADIHLVVLHGALQVPLVVADLTFKGASVVTSALTTPIQHVDGTMSYNKDQLYYTAHGDSAGMTFRTDGTVTGLRRPQIDLAFTSDAVNWDIVPHLLRAWPAALPVRPSGRGVIDFHVIGPARRPRMSGVARAATMVAFGVTATDVSLTGDFQAGGARIQSGSARLAGGTVEVAGALSVVSKPHPFDLHGRFSGISLAAIRVPRMSATRGTAGGTFTVAGAAGAWRGQATADIDHGAAAGVSFAHALIHAATQDGRRWLASATATQGSAVITGHTLPFARAELTAALVPGAVTIQHAVVQALGGRLDGSGRVATAGGLDLNVAATGIRLATAAAAFGRRTIGGTAQLRGRVAGTIRRPTFDGIVTVRQGAVRMATRAGAPARNWSFDRLAGRVVASAQGLDIRSASVQAYGAEVTLSGSVALGHGRPTALNIHAQTQDLPLEAAARLLGHRQPIAGRLSASLTVHGTPSDIRYSGPIHLTGAEIAGFRIPDAQADLQASDGHTLLRSARAIVNGTSFTATGSLGPANTLSVDVAGDSVPLERFATTARPYASLTGNVDVRVHVSGSLSQPDVSGTLTSASPIGVNGEPFDSVSTGFSWSGGQVGLWRFEARRGAADVQVSRADYDPATHVLSSAGSLRALPLASLMGMAQDSRYVRSHPTSPIAVNLARIPKPIDGQVAGTFRLAGALNTLSGPFQLEVSAPQVGQITASSITASGHLVAGRLVVQPARLTAPGIDLTASANLVNPDDQRLTLNVQQSSVPALFELLENLPIVDATPAGQRILQVLNRIPDPTQGTIQSLTVSLAGPPRDRVGTLQFAASNLLLRDQPIDTMSGAFTLENGAAHVDRFIADSKTSRVVINKGSVGTTGDIVLDVTANNIDLSLLTSLAGLSLKASGQADLNALVTGQAASPTLVATLDSSNATIGNQSGLALAVRASVQDNRLKIDQLRIAHGGGSELDASGSLPFSWQPLEIPRDQPLSLAINFNAAPDLGAALIPTAGMLAASPAAQNVGAAAASAVMSGLSQEIKSVTGTVTGQIAVGGTLAHPTASGPIRVTGGGIQFATLQHPLQDIQGTLQFLNDHLEVSALTGRSAGGGDFKVTGKASLVSFPNGLADMQIAFNRLNIDEVNATGIYGESIDHTALSGTMTLNGPLRAVALGGSVTVNNAATASRATLTVPPVPPKSPRTAIPALPNLPLSGLAITLGPNMDVKRGQLRATIDGHMVANGTIANPQISGTLTVERGSAYFGRPFDVQRGSSVRFTYQPPAPTRADLDLTVTTHTQAPSPFGQGQIQNYTVTIQITGTMDNPHLDTFSSPPGLDQHRILASLGYSTDLEALLQGRNVDRIFEQQMIGALTGAVFPQLFASMEENIARSLGLEEFAITFDAATQPQLQLTKQVFGPIYLTYQRMLAGPRDTYLYKLAYRITNTFQLGFSLDDRGARTITIEGRMRF